MNTKHTRISRRLVLANAVGALALTGILSGYGFISTPVMTSAKSQNHSLLSQNAHRTTARPGSRSGALPGSRGAVMPGSRGAALPASRGAALPGSRGAVVSVSLRAA